MKYDVELWCYGCDDFVTVEVLDRPHEFDPFEHFDDADDLPCGHTFSDAIDSRCESESDTLRKKIARRKHEYDNSEIPEERQYLRREILELVDQLDSLERGETR